MGILILLFIICILASGIGAIVGAGGGVIIKPVLDGFAILPVSTVSFCSGCTVLSMAVCSLIRGRHDGVQLQMKTSTSLAVGAVAGGLAGKYLFELIRTGFGDEHTLGAVQSVCLTLINVIVLIYLLNKNRLPSYQVQSVVVSVLIGVMLGTISSFLGIGGGPYNVAILFFFFSMDAKTAAKNSLYIIIFSQISSIASALATGSVPAFRWEQLLAMACGGIGGALIGAAISKRMDNSGVERLLQGLLVVLILLGCYNIYRYAR